MQSFVTLEGIKELISHLHFKPGTQKALLLSAISNRFTDKDSLQEITEIPVESLIHDIWGDLSPKEVKQRRKNLSSLKSALNKDLRKLDKKDKNPEGLIIGKNNVFEVSAEHQSKLLQKMGIAAGKEGSKMVEMFSAFKKAFPEIAQDKGIDGLNDLFEELHKARQDIESLSTALQEKEKNLSALKGQLEESQQQIEEFSTRLENAKEHVVDDEVEEVEIDDEIETIDEDELEEVEVDDDIETIDEDELEEVEVDDDIETIDEDQLEEVEVDDEIETVDEDELEEVEVDDEIETIDEDELEEVEVDDDIETIDEDELEKVEVDDDIETIDEDELEEVEVDDEIETIDQDELEEVEVDDEIETIDEDELEEVEIDDDIETVDEDELEEVEVDDDIETVDEDELEEIEVDDEVETVDEDELEEVEIDDEIETVDEDELEEVEVDDEIETVDEDELEEVEVDDEIETVDEDELEEVEVDDDIETIDEDELEEVEVGDDIETIDEDELEEVEVGDDIETIDEDELEEVEVGDDIETIDEDELEEVEVDDEIETVDEDELEEVEIGDEEPASNKLMEALSKYMDPDDALQPRTDTLKESEEGLVAQLLERFTPTYIKIPAGRYSFGTREPSANEHPLEMVSLKEFYIGQLPVTNDIFDLFVRETGYETDAEKAGYGTVHEGRCISSVNPETGRTTVSINKSSAVRKVAGANWRHPSGPSSSINNKSNHPVVQVSRRDAKSFAAWAGKRLPTEQEWEAAARGPEGFVFPWGTTWDNTLGNFRSSFAGDTTPVERYRSGSASPFAILDLLGNVYEWTSSTLPNAHGNHTIYILKGGCWNSDGIITTCHRKIETDIWSNIIGFRCAV